MAGALPTGWRGFDTDAWQALREEARAARDAGRVALRPVFNGSDIDPHAIRAARENARGRRRVWPDAIELEQYRSDRSRER